MEGEVGSLVMVHDLDFEVSSSVNIEVDFTDREAQQILGVMQRYDIPTYTQAVHWLCMCGLGIGMLDPTGSQTRVFVRGFFMFLGLIIGAGLDHEGLI